MCPLIEGQPSARENRPTSPKRREIWGTRLRAALKKLIQILRTKETVRTEYLQDQVLSKLGEIYPEGLTQYLVTSLNGSVFFDGTKSQVTMAEAGLSGADEYLNWSVAHFFDKQGCQGTAAATSVGRSPLFSFWHPDAISTHDYGEMYNIALVFHESLHGYKNLYDPSLQRKLACTVEDNTDNITMFLRQFVVQTFSPLNVKPCTATSGRLSLCQQ